MKKKKWLISALLLAFVVIPAAGCLRRQAAPPPQPSEPPAPLEQAFTMYFGDQEAEYLLPEERKVTVPQGQTLLQTAAAELPLDPRTPDAVRLMPAETEILGVTAENNLVTINFNEKLRDNFQGGSSSEGLLIYSVVNTLTGIEGYKDYKVRFLINGQPFESIGGHISAEEQFARNEAIIKR